MPLAGTVSQVPQLWNAVSPDPALAGSLLAAEVLFRYL